MAEIRHFVQWVLLRALACAVILFGIGPFESYDEMLAPALGTAASSFNRIYTAPNQDAIAVLLVDDDDLDKLQLNWPLPYAQWARALQTLGCSGVAGVFFDLMFTRRAEFSLRDGGPSMAQTDRAMSAGGPGTAECPGLSAARGGPIPVFYADDAQGRWLNGLVDGDRRLVVEWRGPDGDYPLTQSIGPRRHVSAAYRLYDVVCKSGRTPLPEGCAHPPSAGDRMQSLLPRWTMRWPRQQEAWRDGAAVCGADQPDGFWHAVLLWLRQWRTGPEVHGECLPFLTLSLSQLLNDFDGHMAAALAGRVVLVGASVSGASDVMRLATHGQLPRVYLHATVLENLLSMGSDFDRIDATELHVAVAVLIVLASALVWGVERRLGDVETLSRPLLAALCALTFVVCAATLRLWLRLPPGQIPSAALALTLGLLLGELSQEGRLFKWLRKLLEPAAR